MNETYEQIEARNVAFLRGIYTRLRTIELMAEEDADAGDTAQERADTIKLMVKGLRAKLRYAIGPEPSPRWRASRLPWHGLRRRRANGGAEATVVSFEQKKEDPTTTTSR